MPGPGARVPLHLPARLCRQPPACSMGDGRLPPRWVRVLAAAPGPACVPGAFPGEVTAAAAPGG